MCIIFVRLPLQKFEEHLRADCSHIHFRRSRQCLVTFERGDRARFHMEKPACFKVTTTEGTEEVQRSMFRGRYWKYTLKLVQLINAFKMVIISSDISKSSCSNVFFADSIGNLIPDCLSICQANHWTLSDMHILTQYTNTLLSINSTINVQMELIKRKL